MSRKKTSRRRFGGAARSAAAAFSSRAGETSRRVASNRAETFRSGFVRDIVVGFARRARSDEKKRRARKRGRGQRGEGTTAVGRARADVRVVRGFVLETGRKNKTPFSEKSGLERHVSPSLVSRGRRVARSVAAVPTTQTQGPIARASSAHLGERRGFRPSRLRLGVEGGDRAPTDVHRDAVSPGRARQLERARAGHDARSEGQSAHERRRHSRAQGKPRSVGMRALRGTRRASTKAESGHECVRRRVAKSGARACRRRGRGPRATMAARETRVAPSAREWDIFPKKRAVLWKNAKIQSLFNTFHDWRSIRHLPAYRSCCSAAFLPFSISLGYRVGQIENAPGSSLSSRVISQSVSWTPHQLARP